MISQPLPNNWMRRIKSDLKHDPIPFDSTPPSPKAPWYKKKYITIPVAIIFVPIQIISTGVVFWLELIGDTTKIGVNGLDEVLFFIGVWKRKHTLQQSPGSSFKPKAEGTTVE